MFGKQVSREREYWAWFVLACLLYVLSPVDAVPEALFGPVGLIDDAVVLCAGLYGCLRWAMALGRETALQSVLPTSPCADTAFPPIGESGRAAHACGSQDEVSA